MRSGPPRLWLEHFQAALAATESANLTRRRTFRARDGWIDFGSNDYLSLSCHPSVMQAASQGTACGAGASPVLCGYSAQQAELEAALAEFSGMESGLVFSSGYACNVGTLACLADRGDWILSDALNHASLIDGCRLGRAERCIYPHGDVDFLRQELQARRHLYSKVIILSESLFSMDGDVAPLGELMTLSEQYECGLVVDEAHAVGVYGPAGGGLLQELGLQNQVLAKLGTLSKALGGSGGYVCGSQVMIAYLVNRCRSYVFSTAPPPTAMAAAHAALRQLTNMHDARRSLRATSKAVRRQLSEMGWQVPDGDSPIIPLMAGSPEDVLLISRRLWEDRLYVPAIRPPTVPPGTSRLRISLGVRHSPPEIDQLLDALRAM